MKLTSAELIERSQLIPGVRRTHGARSARGRAGGEKQSRCKTGMDLIRPLRGLTICSYSVATADAEGKRLLAVALNDRGRGVAGASASSTRREQAKLARRSASLSEQGAPPRSPLDGAWIGREARGLRSSHRNGRQQVTEATDSADDN